MAAPASKRPRASSLETDLVGPAALPCCSDEQPPDVTFKVRDETFPAHKAVLARRSPVFNAELYGPLMAEKKKAHHANDHDHHITITVEDMNPDVFRGLLHYIYTHTMPDDMGDLEDDDRAEMTKHLLVAADRYAVGELKRICEIDLGLSIDAKNLAETMALADRHHCSYLRSTCVLFLASRCGVDDLVVTQGYKHIRESCPVALVDMMVDVVRRLQNITGIQRFP